MDTQQTQGPRLLATFNPFHSLLSLVNVKGEERLIDLTGFRIYFPWRHLETLTITSLDQCQSVKKVC